MSGHTTSAEFFEAKYRDQPDPWNFAHSSYERSRYETILSAVRDREFERAFEPGCSVGELTWRLAQRCGHVDALDISATAVETASRRCSALSNVTFSVGGLPEALPNASFDLIVFSEIGYYFDERVLEQLGRAMVHRLRGPGVLLATHWLGSSDDHVLSGDRVHEVLGGLDELRLEYSQRHEAFRLDRWVRT